jgi:hypothetical protein
VCERGLAVAGELVEVRAHAIEPVVPGEPRIAVERLDQREVRACTIAAAIAWLSVTIGLSVIRRSRP